MNCLTNEVLYSFFFFPMQGKNSGKFLWPGLPSDLINPRWDSKNSVAYSIPVVRINPDTLSCCPCYMGRAHFTVLVLRLFRIETCSFQHLSGSHPEPTPPKSRAQQSFVLWFLLAPQHRGLAPRASSSHLTLEGAPSHAAEYSYGNVMGNKQEMRIIQSHPAASTQT